MYNSIATHDFFSHINEYKSIYGFESGFLFYMYLVKIIGFNFYGFTLLNSMIFYILFYKVLKRYDFNINLIIIFFLYKMVFYNTFISLRQPLAILVFWLSLPYLENKNYIKYYIACIFALIMHRSAIILFFIPFFINIKFTKKAFLIYLISGFVFAIVIRLNILNINYILLKILSFIFINDNSAMLRINRYFSSTNTLSILYLLEYYLIACMLYINYNKILDYDNHSKLFIKLFMMLLPIYTIFSSVSIITRFKDYFFISYPIIIIYIANCSKKYKKLIYIVTIIICFYGYIRYLINFDNGGLLNYTTYMFKDISLLL